MCDLFCVLAQALEGITCFTLPRILPGGARNAFRIQRLKGNRSNASSEIELHGAWAQLVGEPGRGVPTIIEMVAHTRLGCMIGTAAAMRRGIANATCTRRTAARGPGHASEALECLGGNGYVEESRMTAAVPRDAAVVDRGVGQRHCSTCCAR